MLCHTYAYADGEGCDCDDSVCYAIRRALTHTSAYACHTTHTSAYAMSYVCVCWPDGARRRSMRLRRQICRETIGWHETIPGSHAYVSVCYVIRRIRHDKSAERLLVDMKLSLQVDSILVLIFNTFIYFRPVCRYILGAEQPLQAIAAYIFTLFFLCAYIFIFFFVTAH